MSDSQVYELYLSWQQFDALEQATDLMVMGGHHVDTLEEAVSFLAERYLFEYGPRFEAPFVEPASSTRPPP